MKQKRSHGCMSGAKKDKLPEQVYLGKGLQETEYL